MHKKTLMMTLILMGLCCSVPAWAVDANEVVNRAHEYFRGQASFSVVEMRIHRPDWERGMTLKAYTQGLSDSIFFVIDPPKDEGNGTLKKGDEMWMYNPKVNRVIKVPPSMMSQSWMGSDFSNNDLAKSDAILKHYQHSLEKTEERDGHKVYIIKSMPKEGAPVVWGMQRLEIRDDDVWMSQEFYDEDLELVKALTTQKIKQMGGRLFPAVWRMQKADAKNAYTQVTYQELRFMEDLPDRIFTVSNLRNPRDF